MIAGEAGWNDVIDPVCSSPAQRNCMISGSRFTRHAAIAVRAAIVISSQELRPLLPGISPRGALALGNCRVMLNSLFLPVFPVVSACCFSQFGGIPTAISPALCVVCIPKTFAFGSQDGIGSFAVSPAPFSLIRIPLFQVFRSPSVSGCFLPLGMPGAPTAGGSRQLRAISTRPSLLGR